MFVYIVYRNILVICVVLIVFYVSLDGVFKKLWSCEFVNCMKYCMCYRVFVLKNNWKNLKYIIMILVWFISNW